MRTMERVYSHEAINTLSFSACDSAHVAGDRKQVLNFGDKLLSEDTLSSIILYKQTGEGGGGLDSLSS